MASTKGNKSSLDFEQQLWQAADMRSDVRPEDGNRLSVYIYPRRKLPVEVYFRWSEL